MTQSYTTLDLNIDERGVASLRLNRPDAKNAMDEMMIDELSQVAASLASRSEVRVVVLTGCVDDGIFCAGGDLRWMQGNMDKPRDEMIAESATLAQMLKSLDELPQTTIGRINGSAFGGGLGLISVCDIAIGIKSATYCLTEVTLGLLPANIAPFVVRRMGPVNARRTFLNAQRFDGTAAVALNLLNVAVDRDELDAAVEREVTLALRCSPQAVAATKALIRTVSSEPFDAAQQYAARALADAWDSPQGREGVSAFFDKRKPSWRVD